MQFLLTCKIWSYIKLGIDIMGGHVRLATNVNEASGACNW